MVVSNETSDYILFFKWSYIVQIFCLIAILLTGKKEDEFRQRKIYWGKIYWGSKN